ncbi:hypothetical protein [Staphylococcus borealis]|uniref:Integral membrane protein n=1 Tax=Staphylococcus borealis TaxID=2742203 RepID=A0ABX2LLK5_9STAP|nr:hypothetical protein [Staphylococcus borealis]MEB6609983.1 hypothetical protein [Staphylococcus borealis]MEB7366395.1 hypothetical protein [Staphylococcus borealis]MEB7459006.1 hypothetical protein [Staphylococcus borealis]NUI79044.1 hypothetical protein [Staphylococcus borealis]NUI81556.1 hypothetical protein [Staphylococcus borealis]
MIMLRYSYHLLSALFISILLLLIMFVMDVVMHTTHLTLLLINIDFIADPNKTPLILELSIHIIIGFCIYITFLIIYLLFKPLYKLSYLLLIIIFLILYPLLITLAERTLFQFNCVEYALWMIAHLIFTLLMAWSIPYFSKKKW